MKLSPVLRVVSCPAVVGACLAVAVGCGVSTNESPEELSNQNLPPELGGAEDSTVPVPEGADMEEVELWFLRESGDQPVLEPIVTDVQRSPSAGIVLERLFTFHGDELGERSMRSAIPRETRVTENPQINDQEGVLLLDLSESFYDGLAEGDGRYAYGQIVLTMADRFGIDAVQFTAEGEEVPVTDGRGAERRSGLVEPADYVNLGDLGD